MKQHSHRRYIIPLIGVLLFNPWVMGWLLTDDGSIGSRSTFIFVLGFDLVLLLLAGLEWGWATQKIPVAWRKIIYVNAIITLLLAVIVAEIYFRTRPPQPEKPLWDVAAPNFPDREQFLQEQAAFSSPTGMTVGRTYYDYHLYAFFPTDKFKYFQFTPYFSARRTPDSVPLKDAEKIVWMFGGSTMENMGTTDELSLANQVAKNLNRDAKAHVFNFGIGSFQSSLESVKFFDLLRRVPETERPDVAVFYDGYNDITHTFYFGAGNIQKDVSQKLSLLVEGKYGRVVFYGLAQMINRIFHAFTPIANFAYSRAFTASLDDYSDPNRDKGVEVYLSNMRMVNAVCKEFNVRCLFVWQPLLINKEGRTPEEERLFSDLPANLREQSMNFSDMVLKSKKSAEFYDLTNVFDNSGRIDFLDYGHLAPYSNIDVAKRIAGFISQPKGGLAKP